MSVPRHLCLPLIAALIAALVAALLAVASPARAAAPSPGTPKGLPAAIEPLAEYVPQTSCDQRTRSGTRALAILLAHTYSAYGATAWSTTYACGTDGDPSEHYDGRAIDWMVNVHDARQHAAAKAALTWLLATDPAGNRFAMARRLGVMYVIYDNRIWGAWSGRWAQYDGCAKLTSRANDNACHRTHMHISLSWNGAMGATSYWTHRAPVATDYGPCRPADLNWADIYRRANPQRCPQYRPVLAAKGASAVKKDLVTFSGAAVRSGRSGPAVVAVQSALTVPATGSFGSATVRAVRAFQTRHHLLATGVMDPGTWRALLAAVR